VARNRLVSAALLTAIALGLDVSGGVPARLTTMARAVWCCSTVCHHAHGAAAAPRCCGVEHDAADLAATRPATPADVGPAAPALAVALPSAASPLALAALDF
jgi:hypothetical protein